MAFNAHNYILFNIMSAKFTLTLDCGQILAKTLHLIFKTTCQTFGCVMCMYIYCYFTVKENPVLQMYLNRHHIHCKNVYRYVFEYNIFPRSLKTDNFPFCTHTSKLTTLKLLQATSRVIYLSYPIKTHA